MGSPSYVAWIDTSYAIDRMVSLADVTAAAERIAFSTPVRSSYDAEAAGRRITRERGLAFVSAYNDAAVIAGGGTIALEIRDDLPSVRTLLDLSRLAGAGNVSASVLRQYVLA